MFDTIIPKVWNLEGVLLAVMFTFYLSCLYIMLWEFGRSITRRDVHVLFKLSIYNALGNLVPFVQF